MWVKHKSHFFIELVLPYGLSLRDDLAIQGLIIQSFDPRVLQRAAALVSCGLGVSPFEWSKGTLTSVFVTFGGK